MNKRTIVSLSLLLGACGSGRPTVMPLTDAFVPGSDALLPGNPDMALARAPDAGQSGCGELQGCYTVYAHSDHVLYRLDLANKLIVKIGPFNAPKISGTEDSIT